MATAKINASCALSRIDMVRAVTIITGPRTSGRMPLHTAFCRTATSLVSRVTSDEVLNRSMLEKEKLCTFWYSARRSSAPKPWPARAARRA